MQDEIKITNIKLHVMTRKKNDRKYMGRRINFSIVITYNKTDNTTDVYFGSPIVNIDF